MGILTELSAIGWKPVFQQQCALHPEHLVPVRVIAVQRTGLGIAPVVAGLEQLPVAGRWFVQPVENRPTVGDWLLVDPDTQAIHTVLERVSLIKRLAPDGEVQLIAANIDTAFLVTSCNADFNLARLERYMAAILEADIQPVVVLTKADQCATPELYADQVRGMDDSVPTELVNALDMASLGGLAGWCGPGQSIALLGSSGVGKSTLVNTLCGRLVQVTSATREGDDKGRHTTTHRSLHRLASGGVILDSPGMREFQITDAQSGVTSVFDDIESLARDCRFNDCAHGTEPGCAVRAAVAEGKLDERRLISYFKLQREELFNRETVAERHARFRKFGKMVRSSSDHKPNR